MDDDHDGHKSIVKKDRADINMESGTATGRTQEWGDNDREAT